MADTDAKQEDAGQVDGGGPCAWRTDLSLGLSGVAALLNVMLGILWRSEAPTWTGLARGQQVLIVFLTCHVVFYFVVVACRLWMRLRRCGTRRWMRQPFTIIAALLALLILPLTAVQ